MNPLAEKIAIERELFIHDHHSSASIQEILFNSN